MSGHGWGVAVALALKDSTAVTMAWRGVVSGVDRRRRRERSQSRTTCCTFRRTLVQPHRAYAECCT